MKSKPVTVDQFKKRLNVRTDYQLAKRLGVRRQAVNNWRKRGGTVPAHHVDKTYTPKAESNNVKE